MKTLPRFFTAAALLALTASLHAGDAHISSWLTAYSTKYARVYTTDAARTAGTSVTTWTNGTLAQTSPAYCGVQEIDYSADWVYVRSTGLGSHIMGPWYNDATRTTIFVNYPKNQKDLFRIPRNPTVPATKSRVQGEIGFFVDGVHAFDSTDATSYSNASARDGDAPGTPGGLTGDGIWNRDAYVNEAVTFDGALAHQQNTGLYHYHANPLGPRYLLGDHVDFNASTKLYSESTAAPTAHSPIVGWAKDGYPIYGPIGYSSPMDAASGLRRMVCGYVPRNGSYNTANLASTGRTTVPAWAVRASGGTITSTTLASGKYGPAVSTTFPLGRYIEDNDYLGDLIKTGTTKYQQGIDFDLDEYNGRTCVTPEYPGGTYAYFVAVSAAGAPQFPYNVGRLYYGTPTGGTVSSIAETVSTYFKGGPDLAETMVSATPGASDVTLVWNSTEGGTYKVEASSDLTGAWSTLSTTKTAAANALQTSYVETAGATGRTQRFYRVTRTALAAYDAVSGTTTTGSSEGISSVSPASAQRGGAVTLTITLNSAYTMPPPPNNVAPTSVTLTKSGATTITATSSSRSSSTGIVTAAFTIPGTATLGAYTVNTTFGPNTWSLTNGFTVQTSSAGLTTSRRKTARPRR